MGSRLPFLLVVSQLNETCHVCAFSSSDEEEYRVLLPFIKGGIQYGDKAVHVASPAQRQDHLRRLGCSGNRNSSGPAERPIRALDQYEVPSRRGGLHPSACASTSLNERSYENTELTFGYCRRPSS